MKQQVIQTMLDSTYTVNLRVLSSSGRVFPRRRAAVDVEEEVNFHQKDRWKSGGREGGKSGSGGGILRFISSVSFDCLTD